MDTRLKNIKYSLVTKSVAAIIMWLSIMLSAGCGAFLLLNTDVIGTDSYESTNRYREEINRLIHNTVEKGTVFKHGANKGADPNRYRVIEDNLSSAVNYNYYIKDLKTNKISYKISDKYTLGSLKDAPGFIHITVEDNAMSMRINDEVSYYIYSYNDAEKMMIDSPQDIYIVINDELVPGDEFYEIYTDYEMVKRYIPYSIAGLIGGLILLLIIFGYLVLMSGRCEKGGEIALAHIDKIPNDIQSFFVLTAAGISLALVTSVNFSNGRYDGRYSTAIIIVMIIFAIDMIIGMTYFFSMLRQFKKGVLLRNTLVFKLLRKVKNLLKKAITFIASCFSEKIFKPWVIGWLLAYGFINCILFFISILMIDEFHGAGLIISMFFIAVFNGLAAYLLFKRLGALNKIMHGAKAISEGNLDYQLDETQMPLEFVNFAKDIQGIQSGLKNAVNDAIKGERMKTDLITNVSHDLKTPLTSIINYVDLLKKEELDNEIAKGYVNILEDKSDRLKQLIEDLIEASKASSGNLIITTEEVNLCELVIQACGEYEEKIRVANLDIRMNNTEDKVLVLADGKYMWRIVENLMSNVLKYSMPNSRVYINIEENDGHGMLIIKNISAYPLDIDPKQLLERFQRGEDSRTTEGSGLGLSIAESLTSIQDGKFSIDIDGDLFKVTIEMPVPAT